MVDSTDERSLRPVVIIGAPRSGTNMLRDVVCQLPGLGTWPCDEINAVWRHGNVSAETDELTAADATPRVQRFIRRAFARLQRRHALAHVVEKTCANSLRVEFVDTVLPEARYIFIVRDGRDAAASAMRRWVAPFDLGYTLKKARFVPPSDAPHYVLRFLENRARRVRSPERRLAVWGPRFSGMSEILHRDGLAAVCGAQWARCVDRAEEAFSNLGGSRVHRVRYERLVDSPAEHVRSLADFLELEVSDDQIERVVATVTPGNVGNWRRQLTESDAATVLEYAGATLHAHGYE
jgi:hypothetical protein